MSRIAFKMEEISDVDKFVWLIIRLIKIKIVNTHQSGQFLRLSITESLCSDPLFFRAPPRSQKA